MTDPVLTAALELTGLLDLPTVLQTLVGTAATLTDAPCAALTVPEHHGVPGQVVRHRGEGRPPGGGYGAATDPRLLARVPEAGALLLAAPAPAFLGVRIAFGDTGTATMTLAGKQAGFTAHDAEAIEELARIAGVAIANCIRYEQSRASERWTRVSQQITTTLLEGTDEEDALRLVAERVCEVAESDACLLILPSVGGEWRCELAAGADDLVGLAFPDEGRAMTVLRQGSGVRVDSLAQAQPMRVPPLRRFGPALYAPMVARGETLGVILVLRRVGESPFEPFDLSMAEGLAQQTALALELAAARHSQDVAHLAEERRRISRDLHDLAIQQLFATGLQMEAARLSFTGQDRPDLAGLLERALEAVDESVGQIRGIVADLEIPDAEVDLLDRLRLELEGAGAVLGFAPKLTLLIDGHEEGDDDVPSAAQALRARIDADLAADVVAVVREALSNVARHARAEHARVCLSLDRRGGHDGLRIEVADDGVGFSAASGRRSGTENLAARARRHSGWSGLQARPEGGTLLVWAVPLN
ncbi:MAG: GAF domain-containing protein [Propioniciclava sp.]|uniref:GAF domain-containing sensor histidine kinase n=1 Tax=Propioniciclava sp. TaxID=2038686 RepID=UPI0039E554B3